MSHGTISSGPIRPGIRLSVIDRCELNCVHCCCHQPRGKSASAGVTGNCLSPDDIDHLLQSFLAMGVRRFSFAGGDLLLRDDVSQILERIRKLSGIEQLELTTSGVRLARYAAELRAAGVTDLNVNLPSRDPLLFAAISQRKRLTHVLQGIDAAQRQGFARIRIVMNLIAGLNDGEAEAMSMYCGTRNFDLRLSNRLPVERKVYVRQTVPTVNLDALRERLVVRHELCEIPAGSHAALRCFASADRFFRIEFDSAPDVYGCSQTRCAAALGSDGRLQFEDDATVDLRGLMQTATAA